MAEYTTPGVYIEEIPHLPPSIASVETAIPAFIGYTEKAQEKEPNDLRNKPKLISSLVEYEGFFGFAKPETGITVNISDTGGVIKTKTSLNDRLNYIMYYSLQLFFANGGSDCFIVSVGDYSPGGKPGKETLRMGFDAIANTKEVTLILFPDALNLAAAEDYYLLHKNAIAQSHDLRNRFVVMDVFMNPALTNEENISIARSLVTGTTSELSYAAMYYPRIFTSIKYSYQESSVKIIVEGDHSYEGTLAECKENHLDYYLAAKKSIDDMELLLPSSSAIAGKYAEVDNSRGVWKAPANVNIDLALRPEVLVTDAEQERLNVDPDGKSINVIRSFPGRGPAIIWGARTLAGNDNEWRYVPVRRFFIMIEESIKNALVQFAFEPNDTNTWVRIRSMIENYLTQQWKAGALQGSSTKEAFYVHVGLGQTMTEQDVLEGRMIVEIGMATVRPAEFIILKNYAEDARGILKTFLMRRMIFFCLLASLTTILYSCARNSAKETPPDVIKKYERLVLEMKADSISQLFTTDAEIGHEDQPVVKGRDSIYSFLSSFKNIRVINNHDEIVSSSIKNDSAIVNGNYKQTVVISGKDTVNVARKIHCYHDPR